MKADERRKAIVNHLLTVQNAVSGTALSEKFKVSRQIIVQDIAILKGLGYEILSTHSGYVIQSVPLKERVLKLWHTTEGTEEELNTIVRLGGTVVDVFVWHKVYGKITAPLNIFSELQVRQFMEGVRSGKSTELMHITGGYHYHTVRAESAEVLDEIEETLRKKGFLAPEI
ncbi:MAG: transcription repressor NadR [Lachnospiraceae bacterium]|nr:transcription repressor NadR [Lachnospiraceae bacterium]